MTTQGRIVHYVDPATGTHQAAVVTAPPPADGVGAIVQAVSLTVLGEDLITFKRDVPHDEEAQRRGSWHWSERT